jgi:glyceraldehyde-3-phosphate dehydrogenase/erythrose-4-phosphate dehydrogenase
MRVGINGMGRIGRLALRAACGAVERPADDPRIDNRLEVVHLNEIKGGSAATAHLLAFDTVQGHLDRGAVHRDLRRARSALQSLAPTTTRSSIIDAPSTMVTNGTMLKVYVWYDNEMGYACRMVDLACHLRAHGICGIAKDLTKTASKSAIKLTAGSAEGQLFRWVAFFTCSKNAMKGVDFFLGGAHADPGRARGAGHRRC